MAVELTNLNEPERKMLGAFEEGYEYLVLIMPGRAGLNELAAGVTLADLKKKKLVAFEGRGNFRAVYLTDEGEVLRKELELAKAAA